MGSYLSNFSVSNRKRTSSQALLEEDTFNGEKQNSPKRRKLKSTTEYIYETLFINGENSDITISALGKEWHLHKIYLGQSGYFSSMFNGSWKESTMGYIKLDIPDENVTDESLNMALGSLYRDDILINPSTVIGLLAAASLLSLDDLIQQCGDIMLDNINICTACIYYTASQMYGTKHVLESCVQYLRRMLMPNLTVQLLKDISPDLMVRLVESAELFVMQVEMDVYSMLRKWLFLKLVPDWEGNPKELLRDTDTFIKAEVTNKNWLPSFLDTPQGIPYLKIFSKIRIEHIITDHASAKVLENDHVLPFIWLLNCYRRQWLYLLQISSGQDLGPEAFNIETFENKSMRCGRTLTAEGQYCWRWTGFNYGIDILISCIDHRILLKRNANPSNCHGAIAPQLRRHIVYRLTVTASSVAENQVSYVNTTGIQHLSLKKDEEVVILTVDQKICYPIHISCNFLFYTPHPISQKGTAVLDSTPALPPPAYVTQPSINAVN